MFNETPERQEHLVKFLEEFRRMPGFCTDAQSQNNFRAVVMRHMAGAWVARPWLMCLFMYFYRLLLNYHEYKLRSATNCSWPEIGRRKELIEKFRFAANYGRLANAEQRAWCKTEIKRYGISPLDAPFMVWSGTIHVKKQRVMFGHWDWIGGFFLMTPLYYLIVVAVATCLCECLSPLTKSICATVYLAEIIFLFKFYKAQSFDVYKIGSKYFKAQGWGFTPILR